VVVDWIREGEVSLPRTPGEPNSLRAWRPWVLEEADGTLRMWYTGSDGTTSRILTAVRPPGGTWGRPAMAIDAGFAGDRNSYGAPFVEPGHAVPAFTSDDEVPTTGVFSLDVPRFQRGRSPIRRSDGT
jgi:hypothetical protein